MIFTELLEFIKHPVYKKDNLLSLKYKFNIFFHMLSLALLLSIAMALLIGMVVYSTGIDPGQHAAELFMDNYPAFAVFLVAVLLAPVIEELIFRWPLVFFAKSRFFPLVFYTFTVLFAFFHIANFPLTVEILIISPALVAPQFCTGLILGFLRVRLGLVWAILLHASYNAVLVCPFLLIKYLNLPVP